MGNSASNQVINSFLNTNNLEELRSELVSTEFARKTNISTGTTFKVSDLEVNKYVNGRYVDGMWKTDISDTKQSDNVRNGFIAGTELKETCVTSEHGLVRGLLDAYNGHHKLVIRPDDIWIAIAIQFATYLDLNGEELRSKFVNHEGKKELVVKGLGDLFTADYGLLSLAMSDQIAANIKDESVRNWIMPNFSTTEPNDKVVGAIVLMSAMKKYFSYKMMLMCGLTEVTLLGTEADWIDLIIRAKRLVEFDNSQKLMTKWTGLLLPVLLNLLHSFQEKPNLRWWSQVCNHIGGGSGPSYVSGWMTVFSVFDDNKIWVGERFMVKNNCYPPREVHSDWPIININDLASGSVTADVLVDDNGTEYKTVMVAGHGGYDILNGNTIQPAVSWALYDKEKYETANKKRSIFE